MKVNTWHTRWLELVDVISSWSKDTSTKVGCVIVDSRNVVLSMGWNGIPREVKDEKKERHERPEKYYWFEHAERNAIYNAASTGRSLKGSTLYTNLFPCADCARGIIQSGISKVIVGNYSPPSEEWLKSFERTVEMFQEAGIKVMAYQRIEDTKVEEVPNE